MPSIKKSIAKDSDKQAKRRASQNADIDTNKDSCYRTFKRPNNQTRQGDKT